MGKEWTKQEALDYFNKLWRQMIADANDDSYLIKIINDWMGRGVFHVRGVYEVGRVGEGFAAVVDYINNKSYELCLGGIHRHIRTCKDCIRQDNPDAPSLKM